MVRIIKAAALLGAAVCAVAQTTQPISAQTQQYTWAEHAVNVQTEMDALQTQWDSQKAASDAAFTSDMGATAAAQQAEVQRVTDLKADQAAWNAQKASQEATANAAYATQKSVEDAAFQSTMIAKRDTEIERQANVSAALAAEVAWNTDRDAAVAAQAAAHAALKATSDAAFTSDMQAAKTASQDAQSVVDTARLSQASYMLSREQALANMATSYDAQKTASDAAFTAEMQAAKDAETARQAAYQTARDDQATFDAARTAHLASLAGTHAADKATADAAFTADMEAARDAETARQDTNNAARTAQASWESTRNAELTSIATAHAANKNTADAEFAASQLATKTATEATQAAENAARLAQTNFDISRADENKVKNDNWASLQAKEKHEYDLTMAYQRRQKIFSLRHQRCMRKASAMSECTAIDTAMVADQQDHAATLASCRSTGACNPTTL